MSGRYVRGLRAVDPTQRTVVGGKGAHLGELSRIEGVRVPEGFCVTTDAYRRVVRAAPALDEQLDRLARLDARRPGGDRTLSAQLRRTIEAVTVPDDVATAITRALARLGGHAAYAVRSSATAEDLPTASFAGQQDSYLNVLGPAAILRHVSRCWASLFTERAVTYRQRNGIDHRTVAMAVVVQRMVSRRRRASCSPPTPSPATAGRLGRGRLRPRRGAGLRAGRRGRLPGARRRRRRPGHRRQAPRHPASTGGGTGRWRSTRQRQEQPALTDAQVVRLVRLGRRIEAHFGRPQDIEWCLVDDDFQIVQSRPITTLFPVPVADDTATTSTSPSATSR